MPITPSLFDDTEPPASLVRRKPSFGGGTKGKNVARLLKQVESLRAAFEREKRRLEDALIFHAAHVRPREERLAALRTDAARALAPFLDDRRLSKADARVLRLILREQIDQLLMRGPALSPDLAALFERLHGIGLEEAIQQDMAEVRAEMAEAFEELGVEMDVPDLRPGMTDEEIAAAAAEMAERMRNDVEAWEANQAGRRKTKAEQRAALRAEQQAARREQVRKIGIGSVYKRLVKALHPDREPDPAERERKQVMMQEVTTAYARQDLHTLLRLEFECLDGGGPEAEGRTDETLQAYAEVLREQIARLRQETSELRFHPRYAEVVIEDDFGWTEVTDGAHRVRVLDSSIGALTGALVRFADARLAVAQVRDLIREHRRVRGRGRRRR